MGSDTPPPQSHPPPIAPGTHVDRYEILAHLGTGGFGSVYRARHSMLGHPVALKLLHPRHTDSREVVARFFQEARAAAAIGNPHIVKVQDCGTSPEGQPFLAMELLDGAPLDQVLRDAGRIPMERAVEIALQVLDGLAGAHEAGIVHRDLKPANLFVSTDAEGGGDFVRILDFGISKVRTSEEVRSATRTGVVMGTPSYMAPEQFRGARDVDARADLYSAAVVLYRMLAGHVPHRGQSYEDLVIRVCTEKPPSLREAAPDVPDALAAMVDRGLALDVDARWQSAGEFALALRASLGWGASPLAPVVTAPARPAVPTPPPAPVVTAPARPAVPTPPPTLAGEVSQAATRPTPAPSMTPGPAIVASARGSTAPRPRRGLLVPVAIAAVVIVGIVAALALLDRDGSRAETAPTAGAPTAAPAAPVAKPELPKEPPASEAPASEAPAPLPPTAPVPVGTSGPVAVGPPAPQTVSREAAEEIEGDGRLRMIPRIVGEMDAGAVNRVLARARAGIASCGERGRSVRVEVQLHLAFGAVSLAGPAPTNQGPAGAAQCVASRIRAAFPGDFEPEAAGIVFVDVTLPAR